ncbi:unnamed protein product [Bursaphelenchus xylophilus]|uniref:(pine wood nematode) hypothetical protein n=1 Tax=Bursaphelenchus xylophilus TaxID=6326 RepID=A0A1I7S0E7_BURXY|nr:unnamed protein product [Bursaphelenchus xylophilus]CAG9132231.1 unnamed protein product [Bursaphelenchus xylophilus]
MGTNITIKLLLFLSTRRFAGYSIVPATMVIGLSGHYGKLGAHVGARPHLFLALALLLSSPAFFGLYFYPYLDVRLSDQFIEEYADSIEEIKAQQTFFNLKGEPWYMAMFAIAKKGQNMLDMGSYNKAARFYESTLAMNLTVDGERYNFTQLCKPLCGLNDQLVKLMDYAFFAEIKWPVSKVMGYNVNIGKHFFNRTVDNRTGELVGAEILAFYYTAMQTDQLSTNKLRVFEQEVKRLAKRINKDPESPIEIVVHGTNIVGDQIKGGVVKTANYLAIGLSVSMVVFLVLFSMSALARDSFNVSRFVLALFSTALLPFLSVCVGIGYLSLLGYSLNLLFVMSPIMILFLLSHFHAILHIFSTFDDQQANAKRSQWNRAETLGALFERIGPVNLLTNLVPVFGLLSGSLFVSPGYASFFLAIGIALFFHWVYQIFVVAPLLALGLANTTKQYQPGLGNGKKLSTVSLAKAESACHRVVVQPYSIILTSALGRIALFALLLLFLGFPVRIGLENLKSDMDFRTILSDSAPAVRGFGLVDKIWNDFHQIVFFVRSPPDFSTKEGYGAFRKFIDDVEHIPNSHSPAAHQSWVFDYFPSELKMDYHSENATIYPPNMTHFNNFINGFPYDAWKDGIKYRFDDLNKTKPVILRMVAMIAYEKVKGLDGKRTLLKACRKAVKANPSLNVVSFDTDSINVDIMENVLPTFYIVLTAFLVSTFVVSFFVVFNFVMSFLAVIGVAFVGATTLGLTVFLTSFHFDLLSLSSYILVAIFGLQISLAFVGDFLTVWAHENRVQRAIGSCGTHVLKAALLAAVMFSFLLLSEVQLFRRQGILGLLTTLAGLLSALLVQPLIGGIIPTKLISQEFCI